MTRVVVLAGEGEYGSDSTMTAFADDLRRTLPDVELDYRTPDVLEDYPTFPKSSFGDLSVLREADVLVVYTRFRVLPDHEMEEIAAYVERRGTVMGLRTSTHAFHYDDNSPWASWNDGFGRDVLGSPWISHHGHSSSTDVSRVPGETHEILAGIPDRFHVRSWLYRVELQPDCRPLLHGEPVDPEDAATPSPVAWIREHGHGRVFFTSLGHPDDFDQEPFRRLLVNAARWCLEIPATTSC
jgi:type 1 glutamine amidotransferase